MLVLVTIVKQALFVCWFTQAANYLDIKGLLDVTCKTVANMIKGNCIYCSFCILWYVILPPLILTLKSCFASTIDETLPLDAQIPRNMFRFFVCSE